MTSYFDDRVHEINMLPKAITGDALVTEVALIEAAVLKTVLLNTGDREFPDDLREKILSIVAKEAVCTSPGGLAPRREAIEYTIACRDSQLLHSLHSAFHTLAGRRIMTRFGYWTDSPSQNLVSRDDHDDPK